MALTPSTMLELGTRAPNFRLPDVCARTEVELDSVTKDASATLILFICNHCPYVILLKPFFADLARTYLAEGVVTIAISSNDAVKYPDDAPDKMAADVSQFGYSFPYLYDEDQSVAKAYRAACTPDIFLFDRERKLVYRGQFDDARPGNGRPVTGLDLKNAIKSVRTQKPVGPDQKPATGCNIKWKPGNAPDYFA